MLLELQNANKNELEKLLLFARQNQLSLCVVDNQTQEAYSLPGIPLSANQLNVLIENSRKSGKLSLLDAHSIIRKNYED